MFSELWSAATLSSSSKRYAPHHRNHITRSENRSRLVVFQTGRDCFVLLAGKHIKTGRGGKVTKHTVGWTDRDGRVWCKICRQGGTARANNTQLHTVRLSINSLIFQFHSTGRDGKHTISRRDRTGSANVLFTAERDGAHSSSLRDGRVPIYFENGTGPCHSFVFSNFWVYVKMYVSITLNLQRWDSTKFPISQPDVFLVWQPTTNNIFRDIFPMYSTFDCCNSISKQHS